MEKVDVLIVGAGASGAAVAWRLSDAGLRVVCLEQGEYPDPKNYPGAGYHWESRKLDQFNVSPNIRKLPADYPINDSDSPIAIANYNAVGGSTILYSGHFPRLHPSDFKVKSLDGVADDWPISYEELEPYFSINDKMMGVSGLVGDPAYPPIQTLLPPIDIGRMGEMLGKGFNKLGWHWWPAYSAIITRRHGNREACINVGTCNTGCPQGAKSSVDVTYWPIALRNGVELRTNCRVKEILVDDDGYAAGARYFCASGELLEVYASIVVVACNGIGTPRLLLNSRSDRFPNGLANTSDMVGRNLMLHPCGYVEGVFSDALDAHLGPQGCCILSQEFYETNVARGFLRGYTMQVLRAPGPLESALAGVARREIPWGAAFHNGFSKRFLHTANLAIVTEDLPDPDNRVTLDPTLKDSNGIPSPRINYRLGNNTKKMLSHGLSRGRELMIAAGAKKTFAFGPVRNTGWHLMGTARMGTNPNTSVVNSKGQTHDVPNLFIVDSSIFVTAGGVNPASTIQALALRISDYIRSEARQLFNK